MGISSNNHRKRKPESKQKTGSFSTMGMHSEAVGVIESNMNRLLTNLETGTNVVPGTYKKAVEILDSCSRSCAPDTYNSFRRRMADSHKKLLEDLLNQLGQGKGTAEIWQEVVAKLQNWSKFVDKDAYTEYRTFRKEYNAWIAKFKPYADKNMESFLKTLEQGQGTKDVYEQATAMLNVLIQLSSQRACRQTASALNKYKKLVR